MATLVLNLGRPALETNPDSIVWEKKLEKKRKTNVLLICVTYCEAKWLYKQMVIAVSIKDSKRFFSLKCSLKKKTVKKYIQGTKMSPWISFPSFHSKFKYCSTKTIKSLIHHKVSLSSLKSAISNYSCRKDDSSNLLRRMIHIKASNTMQHMFI